MTTSATDKYSTVYVPLLNEGVDVVRPTQGISFGDNVFQLMPTPNYDPDDEHWQFFPGSLVKCIKETREGQELLVARESFK
jgi:hypothetical protein